MMGRYSHEPRNYYCIKATRAPDGSLVNGDYISAQRDEEDGRYYSTNSAGHALRFYDVEHARSECRALNEQSGYEHDIYAVTCFGISSN